MGCKTNAGRRRTFDPRPTRAHNLVEHYVFRGGDVIQNGRGMYEYVLGDPQGFIRNASG
jgi:hypothetical protein